MTDKPDNGSNRFGVSEEPEAWSWSKRPGIKANQPKEDFGYNSADAVRQALGNRACQL
jgi:hypothetical protein